jgi:putative spermidine/putrescine transport system substrate-binding protein
LLPLSLSLLAAAPAPRPVGAADADAPQAVGAALAPGAARDAALRLLQPYAKATGTALGEPAWDGSLDALRKLQAAHQVDLALVDGPTLEAGCRAHVLDRLDWSALGRDRFLPQAATECGAGAWLAATVLAWDRDKVPGAPGWADFWDVAQHPGRRGLRRGARGNLEIALMADGIGAGDVYRTLRTAEGVDRAFRKLDQLKPYIVWWDQPSQPAQLLASAKVLLTSAPAASLPAGPKSHLGVQWTGGLQEVASWAQPAGGHARGAAAAILVATDAARQAGFARETGLGPSTRGAFALLPLAARADSPAAPANLQAGLAMDEGFWADAGDKLEARFAAWVGK